MCVLASRPPDRVAVLKGKRVKFQGFEMKTLPLFTRLLLFQMTEGISFTWSRALLMSALLSRPTKTIIMAFIVAKNTELQ